LRIIWLWLVAAVAVLRAVVVVALAGIVQLLVSHF
jgi:hypothetical protein